MEEPLLAALRAVRDQITKLRYVEAGILNLLDGEPVPRPVQISATGDLPEPAPEKPKRTYLNTGNGRKAGPLRGWIAELLEARGSMTVPELLAINPDLDKKKTHALVSSSVWFERVPDSSPATYRLSVVGCEEYAKSKAQSPEAQQ